MERTKSSFKDENTEAGKLQALVPALESTARSVTLTDAERLRHARIQSSSLAVLAVGGVLTLMYLAKAVLILTLVSILIAFMLAPIVELCQRMHLPRSFGSMIAVLVMCAA